MMYCNGASCCMRRVPGSHLGGVPNPEDRMQDFPDRHFLTAAAGDLIFLHCDTLHRYLLA
jgi:ectoine hydroxylase-related dioxygenase (phytanoyl-CoA dioxygenase family)